MEYFALQPNGSAHGVEAGMFDDMGTFHIDVALEIPAFPAMPLAGIG